MFDVKIYIQINSEHDSFFSCVNKVYKCVQESHTFLNSNNKGVSLHRSETTITIDQVGHVFRGVERHSCNCERLDRDEMKHSTCKNVLNRGSVIILSPDSLGETKIAFKLRAGEEGCPNFKISVDSTVYKT